MILNEDTIDAYNILLKEEVKASERKYRHRKRWEDKQRDMLAEWKEIDIERKQNPYPLTKDPRFVDMATLYYCQNMKDYLGLRIIYGVVALIVFVWAAHL